MASPGHPSSPPSPWSDRCRRRAAVDAVPASGAVGRIHEGPAGRRRSPATLAAEHLGGPTWWPSSVSQPGGVDCAGSERLQAEIKALNDVDKMLGTSAPAKPAARL